MVDDYLVVHCQKYTKNNLHHLPDDLNGYPASSKSDDHTFCFFGELSPLSNFHPSCFNYKGKQYHCGEQLIQYKKGRTI